MVFISLHALISLCVLILICKTSISNKKQNQRDKLVAALDRSKELNDWIVKRDKRKTSCRKCNIQIEPEFLHIGYGFHSGEELWRYECSYCDNVWYKYRLSE